MDSRFEHGICAVVKIHKAACTTGSRLSMSFLITTFEYTLKFIDELFLYIGVPYSELTLYLDPAFIAKF